MQLSSQITAQALEERLQDAKRTYKLSVGCVPAAVGRCRSARAA